eukprot:SAG31_NODE_602_length_13638_cov_32.936037_1_plen_66_part_00
MSRTLNIALNISLSALGPEEWGSRVTESRGRINLLKNPRKDPLGDNFGGAAADAAVAPVLPLSTG